MRLAIFCALRWECRPVLRALRQVSRGRIGRWQTWTARVPAGEVVVVQTGVGQARAGEAAAAIAASRELDLMISAGCAGALAPALRPGDVVIASSIVADGARFEPDAVFESRAIQICEKRNLRFYTGAILTSPSVLTTVAARCEAIASSGAIAVEMEAAGIARVAVQRGIPIAEVRSVLDSADLELHESGDFMNPETGRLRPLEVLRFVATNPSAATHLLELRRMMFAAEKALQTFFGAYLA